MATRTGLISAINTQITALVTTAKHRLSMLSVVDELFSTMLYDDDTTTNVVTKVSTQFDYELSFSKTGNKVNVVGTITNNTSTIINSVVIFNFTNTEYQPKGFFSFETIPTCVGRSNQWNTQAFGFGGINMNNFLNRGNFMPDEQYYINFTYTTNNI